MNDGNSVIHGRQKPHAQATALVVIPLGGFRKFQTGIRVEWTSHRARRASRDSRIPRKTSSAEIIHANPFYTSKVRRRTSVNCSSSRSGLQPMFVMRRSTNSVQLSSVRPGASSYPASMIALTHKVTLGATGNSCHTLRRKGTRASRRCWPAVILTAVNPLWAGRQQPGAQPGRPCSIT